MPTSPVKPAAADAGAFAWRSLFAIVVVALLGALGVENMVLRARTHEVEDGVSWAAQAEGVTAVEVYPGSAGDAAGIQRGDILAGVNGSPVRTPADIVEFQHHAQ